MTTSKGRKRGQTEKVCGGVLPDGIHVCQSPPGWGTDHKGFGRCRKHGGDTVQGHKRAAVIEAKQRAKEFGNKQSNQIDPADALRQELTRTNNMLEWAREMCQTLIDAQASTKAPKTDIIDSHQFLAYRLIMDQERDRLVRIARSSMDTTINARKQALAEALAAVVIDCFHSMTRQIPDLTPVQLEAAQEVLKSELTSATERLLLMPAS